MIASGWWRAIGIACGVLFLAACSENADLFSSLDDPVEPELSTVKSGSVIGEAAPLEVQIEYPSDDASRATSMRVELRDAQGTVHGTVEFDQAQLAEPRLPTVKFSEPPEGVYLLVTEAWINDQPLFSDRRQVFLTSVPPQIESVTIHPTSIRREMQALAVADVDSTVSTRPYLRWIFDGGVAAEGYLEDGLDRTILDGAGRSAGAYQVSLEVYPWGVDEGAVIDGSTTIAADSDVVVREELEPGSPEFASRGPGRVVRYFSFDGTRQAWTESTSSTVEATVEGEVFLDMISGALGVRIPSQGVVSAPIPTLNEADLVRLVELRLTAFGSTVGSPTESVISFATAGETGEPVPITIEDGAFFAHPPGSSPISLSRAPEDGELVTLRFLLRNQDGSTFLEPSIDGAASARAIRLGPDSQGVSVAVRGHGEQQLFLDRITVTALAAGEFQTDHVQRATERFIESFDERLGEWAVTVPSDWTTLSAFHGEYPEPADLIEIGGGESPFMHALLPDGGALDLRREDDSAVSLTLRRRGDVLELTGERLQDGYVSRMDISEAADGLELHRLALSRRSAENGSRETADIRMDEDDRGEFISLHLPETLWSAAFTVVPEAGEADYPVWVGRWAR